MSFRAGSDVRPGCGRVGLPAGGVAWREYVLLLSGRKANGLPGLRLGQASCEVPRSMRGAAGRLRLGAILAPGRRLVNRPGLFALQRSGLQRVVGRIAPHLLERFNSSTYAIFISDAFPKRS